MGISAELIRSGGGVFEIEADGKLIFSKKHEHRFPTHNEVLESLKNIK
jgi:selT/selW/selH-like putative selenoprotein